MQEEKMCVRANNAGQMLSARPFQITGPNSAFGVTVIIGLLSVYADVLETGICPTEITL